MKTQPVEEVVETSQLTEATDIYRDWNTKRSNDSICGFLDCTLTFLGVGCRIAELFVMKESRFWPIVKLVRIGGPWPRLTGFRLFDAAGFGDANRARRKMAYKMISCADSIILRFHNCLGALDKTRDIVWIAIAINPADRTRGTWIIFGQARPIDVSHRDSQIHLKDGRTEF